MRKLLQLNKNGFTLLELMMALGASAVLAVITMSVVESLQRSKETTLAGGAQTELRTLIFSALKDSSSCASKLQTTSGTFAGIIAGTSVSVKVLAKVGGTPILSDGEVSQGVTYSLALNGGPLVRTIAASPSHPVATNVYNAGITLNSNRTTIGLGVPGKAQIGAANIHVTIPVTVEIDNGGSGNLISCVAFETDTELLGGANTLNSCSAAGGTVVVTAAGRLCLFVPVGFTISTQDQSAVVCMGGFGCTYNTTFSMCDCASSTTPVTPCPAGPPPSTAQNTYGSGSAARYYCEYTTTPVCTNPYVVPATPPIPGPHFWCELSSGPPPAGCNPPGVITGPPSAPVCQVTATAASCPAGTTYAGICPSPHTADACCMVNSTYGAVTLAGCPAGFTAVSSAYTSAGPPYTSITCD